MGGVVFDSSVYIDSIRTGNGSIFADRRIDIDGESKTVHLSSVVLQELNAGAVDNVMVKLLAKFENDFDKSKRLLVPNLNDWKTTGQVLLQIGKKYGFEQIKRSRMTNDCLIAMSARRCGLIVITTNTSDFQMIAEFRPFSLLCSK